MLGLKVLDIEGALGVYVPDAEARGFVDFVISAIFETKPPDIDLTIGEWLGAIQFHIAGTLERNGYCPICGSRKHEGSCRNPSSVH